MSKQSDLEMRYGGVTFEDAIHAFVIDTPKIDADPIAAETALADMFEYYGVQRLSKGFDKLDMPSRMYLVGGIVQRFTAGFPDGAGFSEIKMDTSEWQCFLIKKGAGYEPEVEALRKAGDE